MDSDAEMTAGKSQVIVRLASTPNFGNFKLADLLRFYHHP